jgi:cytochrome c biogenesis protein CcmG/thiol:disulfide interchange protein DsbE
MPRDLPRHALFALLVLCSACSSEVVPRTPSAEKHPLVGVHAPSFSRPALNASSQLSVDAARGHVLIVDFWATYCKPCEKSFPALQAIVDKHPDAVKIYALSEDDEREPIGAFVRKTGVRFSVAWDEGNAVSRRYHLDKMPTTYVIDRRGVVRFVHSGYEEGDERELEREVEALAR